MPQIISNSPDDTAAIGIKIASFLLESQLSCRADCSVASRAGSIIALNGTLGSGKTFLAKSIAKGLGITHNITSPTYTIINEYLLAKGLTMYHIDAYRLENVKDFEDIGGIEIINSNNICLIEWSERILNALPSETITITLEITGSESRLINIEGLKGEINFEQ